MTAAMSYAPSTGRSRRFAPAASVAFLAASRRDGLSFDLFDTFFCPTHQGKVSGHTYTSARIIDSCVKG